MSLETNNQRHLEPLSILVVETDPIRRRWIEHALSAGHYLLMTVGSAKQGLQYLKRNRVDVVVMGEHLRAIGVTEWISEIRQLYPDLPVIVDQAKWPVRREYIEGSPGGFQSLVRSLQSQDATLRESVEEVSRGRRVQSPG
jgi:CheY-like chemotaxis protein